MKILQLLTEALYTGLKLLAITLELPSILVHSLADLLIDQSETENNEEENEEE